MRFTYYSEKTIPACLSALNERLHAKGRLDLDGWIDKNGTFSLSVQNPVVGKFTRRTALGGRLEREGGMTIIHGNVSAGLPPTQRRLLFVVAGIVALALLLTGTPTLALVLLPFIALLYIPARGDYENSDLLLSELQKTLKAKSTPPKPTSKSSRTAERAKTPAATASSLVNGQGEDE